MKTQIRFFNRKSFWFISLVTLCFLCALITSSTASAATGVNQRINFQGRLLTEEGATVPDGYYNIQFKIYQDGDGQSADNATGSPAGTLMWTEDYLNDGGNGVVVKNGFMSVQLGSINPFGSSVDWNQDTLWLSMNIGGTDESCTPFANCNPDGEMLPMKRLSSTPYSLNSALLGGVSSAGFVQLAQGLQEDASSTTSIHINKTGTGDIMSLQSGGTEAFTVGNTGDVLFGANADHSITIAQAATDTNGRGLTVAAGDAGTGSGNLSGGNLILSGGAGGGLDGVGGDIVMDAGTGAGSGIDGQINIGANAASSIQIGSTSLVSGAQTITIGANNNGGTTDVTIGSGSGAASGETVLQSRDNLVLRTNGINRATFDTAGYLFFGNGASSTSPLNFVVSGTQSGADTVDGGSITLQGGDATTGNANGGSLVLRGGTGNGTGTNGSVLLGNSVFSAITNDANCYTNGLPVAADCTISADSINSSSAIIIGFSESGHTATLPEPDIKTAGRMVYISAADGSADFILTMNEGGAGNTVSMRQNSSATMIWNGVAWTAAGASSSTTLQSAYDNTLQGAGSAELVVSKTSATNGLTIRESSVNPVNGTLFSVQNSSAAGLLSVKNAVTEYASNGGAEIGAVGSPNSFPSTTWESTGAATVTRYTDVSNFVASGQASSGVETTTAAGDGVKNTLNTALTAQTTYNVSFAARLETGTFTDMSVHYSVDGTSSSVPCLTEEIVATSFWKKINCTFVAPSSGITSDNAIIITQNGSGTARNFYVDNLSVTIAADYNYASDGGIDDDANFSTNWTAANGATVSRNTSVGQSASTSAEVQTTGSGQGIRNQLAIAPVVDTLYRISVYASSTTTDFDTFTVRYSPDGGSTFTECADYNTQTVSSPFTNFSQINCYLTTEDAASDPYVYFTQGDGVTRTFFIDTFSMTLSTDATPHVQIGGGAEGGPTTLLTLDRAASAPIASNNQSLLGSMYYDTTLGKLQCYESDGWGACGSPPDNVVTISPEYTNAVMHGTGVGTMTSDICSSTLGINDGTSGQPSICEANETFNFYKWTSPQATAQNYSIYVTYQLPETFQNFTSGKTSLMGRTDSSNSQVSYELYRNDPSLGMSQCGSEVVVSSGATSSWQIGVASGATDPSTCGFIGGNSIVVKINVTASQNANAYVGNLNFTFTNR